MGVSVAANGDNALHDRDFPDGYLCRRENQLRSAGIHRYFRAAACSFHGFGHKYRGGSNGCRQPIDGGETFRPR